MTLFLFNQIKIDCEFKSICRKEIHHKRKACQNTTDLK